MANYDVIVLGGGAAGLAAARTAKGHGARPLIVHDGPLGGDCTFTGCVPSKTLIEGANGGASYAKALGRLRATVARIASTEDAAALSREGIATRQGKARFTSPDTVDVGGTSLRCRRFVVATGSRPDVPAVRGLAESSYLTNETVFDLPTLPRSLAILGGGAQGCELAQAFARFGAAVTVLEAGDRLLPREEAEASQIVGQALTRDGVHVKTQTRVTAVMTRPDGALQLSTDHGATVTAEHLLVATGRSPAVADLGLAEIGVALDDRGYVRTDAALRTTVEGIYAAGDVTGRLPFTHAADAMGRIAATNALTPTGLRGALGRSTYDSSATPWVTFTDPEVGRLGITEDEAGRDVRVAYLPLSEVDRALTAESPDGFIKILAAPRRVVGRLGGGRVVGATIVAPRAGEMIAAVALAMHTGMFAGRLAQATQAYPTWSSGVQLAAAQLVMEIGGRRARPAGGPP